MANDGAVTLRIITMNDVYQLDNLPRVKSFIDAHRIPNTLVSMHWGLPQWADYMTTGDDAGRLFDAIAPLSD